MGVRSCSHTVGTICCVSSRGRDLAGGHETCVVVTLKGDVG
jgi:hypothetical protein